MNTMVTFYLPGEGLVTRDLNELRATYWAAADEVEASRQALGAIMAMAPMTIAEAAAAGLDAARDRRHAAAVAFDAAVFVLDRAEPMPA